MQTANGATVRAEVLGACKALFSAGERVCVALSGGADSVALLYLLRECAEALQITLSAAHFNHCLRGSESERDERFVRALCAELQVPLRVGRGNVREFAEERGLSLETAARRLRYEFLESLDCDRVATAHHADDNAETVLLHLLRGSGLRGLGGIPPARGRFVRPLLRVTRAQLEGYLQEIGAQWVTDSTNFSDEPARNRLRHNVLPQLARESPDFSARLAARCAILREEDEYLDSLAAALLRPQGGPWEIAPLLRAPEVLRRRALRLAAATALEQDVSLAHIEALCALLESRDPSAQVFLPCGVRAQRRYDTFFLTSDASPLGFSPVRLPLPGCAQTQSGWHVVCEFTEKCEEIRNSPFHFCLSCAIIRENALVLRPRRTGDCLMLAGGTHRTVKKLFIDRKVPRAMRDTLPVLESGGAVLAVAGLGASRDALPQAGQAAWIIRVKEKEEISHAQ